MRGTAQQGSGANPAPQSALRTGSDLRAPSSMKGHRAQQDTSPFPTPSILFPSEGAGPKPTAGGWGCLIPTFPNSHHCQSLGL